MLFRIDNLFHIYLLWSAHENLFSSQILTDWQSLMLSVANPTRYWVGSGQVSLVVGLDGVRASASARRRFGVGLTAPPWAKACGGVVACLPWRRAQPATAAKSRSSQFLTTAHTQQHGRLGKNRMRDWAHWELLIEQLLKCFDQEPVFSLFDVLK